MSKETPREFWIYDSGTRDKPVWEYEPEDAKECIHVIEYAAYEKLKSERPADYFNHYRKERDALQKENEELKADIAEALDACRIAGREQSCVEIENASLRESLKEAYEALDLAMTVWQTDWKCATCVELNEACYYKLSNALAKIKDKNGYINS